MTKKIKPLKTVARAGGKPAAKTRFLHLHSTFDAGGKELRAVRLINAFGPDIAHSIVSAEPQSMAAAAHISKAVSVDYPDNFPSLAGFPTLGRLKRLAEAMRGYDLVLTYNWGAMDAVMAHTLYSQAFRLPPLIHHEDGFNSEEALKLKKRRNWYRQIALGRTAALIVPSQGLAKIAHDVWHQPASRIHRIANGIATATYGKKPKADKKQSGPSRNPFCVIGIQRFSGTSWLTKRSSWVEIPNCQKPHPKRTHRSTRSCARTGWRG